MTRAAFRGAWRAGRRCLVLADGYYEWRNADKQPFAIALANRGPMTLAGLWDEGDRRPARRSNPSPSSPRPRTHCWRRCMTVCRQSSRQTAGTIGLGKSRRRSAPLRPCCGLIRTRPWRSGPSIGGLAMSGTTAQICSRRLNSLRGHSATRKLRKSGGSGAAAALNSRNSTTRPTHERHHEDRLG